MIELRRIVLLNWHMMTRADLDVGGNLAILGQNRSGKSTLIDLIQAVLAGGSSRLYRFNRSAGEGTGRSDRTLAGYCLGQLSDDSFVRQEAISYIALVFDDVSGKRPPVTLGLAIEATRGPSSRCRRVVRRRGRGGGHGHVHRRAGHVGAAERLADGASAAGAGVRRRQRAAPHPG